MDEYMSTCDVYAFRSYLQEQVEDSEKTAEEMPDSVPV